VDTTEEFVPVFRLTNVFVATVTSIRCVVLAARCNMKIAVERWDQCSQVMERVMNGLLLTVLPLLCKWTLHNVITQQDTKNEDSSQRYIPRDSSLPSQHGEFLLSNTVILR
jgi:hypothetical protein